MGQTIAISLGNLTFNVRVAGDERDELVILLHGFPETSMMWAHLMANIASRGFYCMAPDMRGYSPQACPKGAKHYSLPALSQDILDLAGWAGKDTFHLIGHDWGAVIGWNIVYHHHQRIKSWSALSVPHSSAFAKALKSSRAQQKKSRYIRWFMIPVLPELWLRKGNFKFFRKLWKHSRQEEVAHYLSVFRRKQSLTAALNYYRANLGKNKFPRLGRIKVPSLFIWGKYDLAIGKVAAEGNHSYMKGAYAFLALEGGHWLIQTNYNEVEDAIIKHITADRPAA